MVGRRQALRDPGGVAPDLEEDITLADRVLRGSRLERSVETDRDHDLAPAPDRPVPPHRQRRGLRRAVRRRRRDPVEVAVQKNGMEGNPREGAGSPRRKGCQSRRTHWDMLLERRSEAGA